MPKQRRDRSTSFDRSRASPFSYNSRHPKKPLPKNPLENQEITKDWEDARCPVCMEHPHNAVLLVCSSHDKGCRPFMCDTSYRHTNCFDQFRKSFAKASLSTLQQDESSNVVSSLPASSVIAEATVTDGQVSGRDDGSASMQLESCEDQLKPKLVCPLCRGQINGWMVAESARSFMNAKSRGCACESCGFSGTYTDLRKHARQVHPLARPADADPERQQNWRRLEQQRDLGDLLSTLQSSVTEEISDDSSLSFDEGGWLTVFLLVRILQPGSSSRSRSWSGASRTRARVTIRRRPSRRLWGETFDWESDSRDDDDETSDGGSRPQDHHDQVHRRSTSEN